MNAIVSASGNDVTISGTAADHQPGDAVSAFFHGPVDRNVQTTTGAGGFATGTTNLPNGTYDITITFPGGNQFATVTLPASSSSGAFKASPSLAQAHAAAQQRAAAHAAH
jgi:hypothetical protein